MKVRLAPVAHSILCVWAYSTFAILSTIPVWKWCHTIKRIYAGHIPCLGFGMSKLHFHNNCFDIDETRCVSYHISDEQWVPPSSNCLHHQSDCKLTNSAGHQLAQRLQQNRKAGRDDGIIRYLCLLLCLVQQGVAHNSGSWYSVYHLLRYKGW